MGERKAREESAFSRGSRNTVTSFLHRDEGMQSGPFYLYCPSFLYHASKPFWPCAVCCFLQLAQLSLLSSAHVIAVSRMDEVFSLLSEEKKKCLAQDGHEESDGCINDVTQKDSKS